MADSTATRMTGDALVWWNTLDRRFKEVGDYLAKQCQAILSKYGSTFCGGSGEEAEQFIRAVRDKAIDEGKRNGNEWIVAYAESCLAGEALRWYTYLDSDTQGNWKKLQQALLLRYPRLGGDTAGPISSNVPCSGSQSDSWPDKGFEERLLSPLYIEAFAIRQQNRLDVISCRCVGIGME
ncbi:hypothetical protein FS837_004305 [Tulasnella sp. UAMH 9824]|nr:hypothetical protein FS837_004305 [Tulasnella sp. UAMH 9824]